MAAIKQIGAMLLFLALSISVKGQGSISGKQDSLGLKQGKWVYEYNSHELVPTGAKTWVIANYRNDTLFGEYRVISADSSFQYFFNTESNIWKGYAYLLENKKIRKTFYYVDSLTCFVSEFDDKGRLFRTYTLTDNKQNGIYTTFEKGKIVILRVYEMGVLKDERINKIK